jgi:hypothetical protein
MTKWHVVKVGAEMLDALHAYGLGILIASATDSPVELNDKGIVYELGSQAQLPRATTSLLDRILQLPFPGDVRAQEQDVSQPAVQMGNLDGLLASLFTTPGIRAVSAADLLGKQSLRPTAIRDGLKKVNQSITRWRRYAQRQTPDSSAWLTNILEDYEAMQTRAPLPVNKRGRDLSVLMALDPAFSCSNRRPISDGLITCRTNIALHGTPCATVLALFGAARFLRAQRVSGKLVNFYTPLPEHVILDSTSTLPLLRPVGYGANQAVAFRWLRYRRLAQSAQIRWRGLAYQIMRTQGAQQSISLARGCIDYANLARVERKVGPKLGNHWEQLLRKPQQQLPFEIDDLVDCLLRHQAAPWLAHLRDVSLYLHNGSEKKMRPYRLGEVKEVTTVMKAATEIPLSAILEREQGTLRFGHALRLLGRYNTGPLRDIIDSLDSVQTCNQLMHVLAQAVQECAVASAKTPFIVIPDDEDLKLLLDDVDHYGARTVAELLIILSALRYPRKGEDESSDESESAPPDVLEEGEGNDN